MVVIGAGGHAIEVLHILSPTLPSGELFFFDNVSPQQSPLFGLYAFIESFEALAAHFANDPSFVLAVGSPQSRRALSERCRAIGGAMHSVISPDATIGDFNVLLGNGLNVMRGAVITGDVSIGEGTLINALVSVHHGVRVGAFCEISPGARLLGGCVVGNGCSIGANAVVLPGIRIADGAVVGAGAVVTHNVNENEIVAGVPARLLPR